MMFQEQQLGSLAFCWLVQRRDGGGIALTSHDRSLERDGLTFRSDPGVVPASITRSLGLEAQSGEVAGALSSKAISERDLELGRWDGAHVSLMAIDWASPEAAPVHLLSGELGEVTVSGTEFTAELRGAASKLGAPVCPTSSPECRAQLGDKSCRVDMAGRRTRARLIGSAGNRLELDRPASSDNVFGRLRYLSGENCGAATVIVSVEDRFVSVRDLPRRPLEPGCAIELSEGCDKRLETCAARFGNAVNFRGEPHLPGNDLLTRYPGS